MERGLAKKIRNMTLFKKMLFFYIAFLMIPTLVIGTFYIGNFSRGLKERYRKSKEEVLEQGKNFVERSIEQISSCTRALQYNTGVLRYVENYDVNTGDGVVSWMTEVKPAIDQLKGTNPQFSNIRIYRRREREHNDLRYVLNASDNEELRDIEPMDYRSVKIFFHTEGESTQCHVYRALYDVKRMYKAGYVEVDCDADLLFSTFHLLEEEEVLLLNVGEESYRIQKGQEGMMYLESWEKDRTVGYQKAAAVSLESLDGEILYYYPDLEVFSDSEMFGVILVLVLLFVFFSVVYYAFYLSITRRITNLTEHMLHSSGEKMQPYRTAPSNDEIGTMVSVYNQTANRMNQLIDEIYKKERRVNQAQYYAMQSQIQPHFLYNTLENIDMLIEVGENEKASKMMAVFGKILRYNLSMRKELATIEEEVGHIEEYLKLYAFRMSDDFSYEITLEQECGRVKCPYCMLQPVVENCFKHGFRKVEQEKWVHVRAYVHGEYARIDVEDNGAGITEERLREIEDGLMQGELGKSDANVGLDNVNERIRLLCKSGSKLGVYPKEQGCLVRIEIRI